MSELEGYKYTYKGNEKKEGHLTDIYTFKSDLINHQYIVEVINLEHEIYIVQFYLKCHRLSANRFNLFIPESIKTNVNNNKHVFLLLNTLTNLALEISQKNPLASFGFMGAPTTSEQNYKKNKKNINPDKTIKETKRFRVYSLYIKRYFPPETFTHIEYRNSSCYLLQNLKNKKLNKEIADDFLNKIITEKIAHN